MVASKADLMVVVRDASWVVLTVVARDVRSVVDLVGHWVAWLVAVKDASWVVAMVVWMADLLVVRMVALLAALLVVDLVDLYKTFEVYEGERLRAEFNM